jgi:hypothetical protein
LIAPLAEEAVTELPARTHCRPSVPLVVLVVALEPLRAAKRDSDPAPADAATEVPLRTAYLKTIAPEAALTVTAVP